MGTVGRLSATNAGVVELGSGDDASRFFQYCNRWGDTPFRRAKLTVLSADRASSASAARASASLHCRHARPRSSASVLRVIPRA